MKLRPLNEYVLVRRADADSVSSGGIIIPETAKRKTRHGEVLAVGSGKYSPKGKRLNMSVKVGDMVYFRGISGQEVELDGETLVLLKEDEIEAIVC